MKFATFLKDMLINFLHSVNTILHISTFVYLKSVKYSSAEEKILTWSDMSKAKKETKNSYFPENDPCKQIIVHLPHSSPDANKHESGQSYHSKQHDRVP